MYQVLSVSALVFSIWYWFEVCGIFAKNNFEDIFHRLNEQLYLLLFPLEFHLNLHSNKCLPDDELTIIKSVRLHNSSPFHSLKSGKNAAVTQLS